MGTVLYIWAQFLVNRQIMLCTVMFVSSALSLIYWFLFFLLLYIPVNSYGHVLMVISPSHTFSVGKLEQAVT